MCFSKDIKPAWRFITRGIINHNHFKVGVGGVAIYAPEAKLVDLEIVIGKNQDADFSPFG